MPNKAKHRLSPMLNTVTSYRGKTISSISKHNWSIIFEVKIVCDIKTFDKVDTRNKMASPAILNWNSHLFSLPLWLISLYCLLGTLEDNCALLNVFRGGRRSNFSVPLRPCDRPKAPWTRSSSRKSIVLNWLSPCQLTRIVCYSATLQYYYIATLLYWEKYIRQLDCHFIATLYIWLNRLVHHYIGAILYKCQSAAILVLPV